MKLLFAIALLASSASASVVFTLGNHPQPNEQLITFPAGPTWNINGHDPKGDIVSINASNIQTSIWVVSPTFDAMSFDDIIINPLNPQTDNGLQVQVVSYASGKCYQCYDWFTWGKTIGDNYLTINTTENSHIWAVFIYGGYPELNDLEMSGITLPTPEPGTLALLSSGLIGIGAWLRHR